MELVFRSLCYRWWWRRATQHEDERSRRRRSHSTSSAAACSPATRTISSHHCKKTSHSSVTRRYRYDPHLWLVEVASHAGRSWVACSFCVFFVVLQLEQQVLFLETQFANCFLFDVLIHQVSLHLRRCWLVTSNCAKPQVISSH